MAGHSKKSSLLLLLLGRSNVPTQGLGVITRMLKCSYARSQSVQEAEVSLSQSGKAVPPVLGLACALEREQC